VSTRYTVALAVWTLPQMTPPLTFSSLPIPVTVRSLPSTVSCVPSSSADSAGPAPRGR
jgi:hypothetical protein